MSTSTSKIRHALFLATLPLIALSIGPQAHAEQTVKQINLGLEVGASERVDYSGKLRMLSQRVVASGCNYAAGIDPENSGADMRASKAEFTAIVEALENGNSELGIHGAEARKKTLFRIGKVKDAWAPAIAELTVIDESGDEDAVASLAKLSSPLLEEAKTLVSEISAQYSDPAAMVQASAFQIDIAGRQRMLAQNMSKNVCLVASGVSVEAATLELAATSQLFEISLLTLRGGNKSAGINPPPNSEVTAGLNVVLEDWKALKPAVESILDGVEPSNSERVVVYQGMNSMTANMNRVVGLYSKASKQGSMY